MAVNFSNEDFNYEVKWKNLKLTIVLKIKSNQKNNAERLLLM
jgi:hypothetical protein